MINKADALPKSRFGSLYRTLALSLALPLVAIQVLLHAGASPVIALGVATVFPLAEMAYEAWSTKRVGLIAFVSLIGIVAGFGLSFVTGNAIFALLKDSLFTAVFGVIFLGSLATARPLIFRLNLDMAGTDLAARAATETMWERPGVPAVFRLMTFVWGAGLLLEAGLRVVAAFTLPIATATALSPVISVAVIGAILVWTVLFARAKRAAAARRMAALG